MKKFAAVRSKLILPGKLLKVFLLLLLTTYYLLHTPPAFAQTAQAPDPNPQPCKNAVSFDKLDWGTQQKVLTDNYVSDNNGDPPPNLIFDVSGEFGKDIQFSPTFTFTVDFSKLEAVFAENNSDYLEGKFQDQTHQNANVMGLNSADLNNYFGALQKTAPKIMLDNLKINYIHYVTDTFPDPKQKGNNHIPEATNKITDIDGNNPKTVYDMYSSFGAPKPIGETQDPNTWGKYWSKIPTTYDEFYEGKLEFRPIVGKQAKEQFLTQHRCFLPDRFNNRIITFVMPDLFRTAAVSGQLNQIVLPKTAQSSYNNLALKGAQVFENQNSGLASLIEKCIKFATQNPLIESVKKVIKLTLNNLNPVKDAYAIDFGSGCRLKIQHTAKPGSAPFCALPDGQAQPGECNNNICTFVINFNYTIDGGNVNEQNFDCDPKDPANPNSPRKCKGKVWIYPDFRIPFLATVWNNSLYSAEKKPGVYTLFTPQAAALHDKIDLPGKDSTAQSTDPKENFIGGTDCAKQFVRDSALKPIALQQTPGTNTDCAK